MGIINTRSPYFLSTTNSNLAYAELDIEIYSGEKDSDYTGNNQYSLRKNIILTQTTITFEISELIRDYLDMQFNGTYYDSDQDYTCRWVRMTLTSLNGNGVQLSQSITTNLAIDGYSYFEEGLIDAISSNVLMSNRDVFALDDNIYRIPLYTGTSMNVTFLLNGEIVNTYTSGVSSESEEQIKHISINDISQYDSFISRIVKTNGIFENNSCISKFKNSLSIGKVDTIHIGNTDGTLDIINVKTIDECKYEPKKITFINKFGVLQDMYFFKKSVEKMTTKRESYKANTLTQTYYNTNTHTKRDFNIEANESVSLSSGFLNESYNEVFKQMMLSEKVWITNRTNTQEQVLPINIKTSNITYKTSVNDRLVEYTIEFDNSYNVLNDIR